MRKSRDRKFWEEELAYIQRTRQEPIDGTFNYDLACFRRYVVMQAHFAKEDGFDDLADQMQTATTLY